MKWNRVTIVGCGLIGASFALALRRSELCGRIAGWDASPQALDGVLAQGIIDEVDGAFGVGRAVSSSNLIYLAMPVGEIIRFLHNCRQHVMPGTIITDAGSTKQQVCRAAREHLAKDQHFVGGHPIAGSHHTGYAHAAGSLFEAAPYVLISDAAKGNGGEEACQAVQAMVESFGARVVRMTAAEHDRRVAFVSHLPQLLSSALAATVEKQADQPALCEVAGAGYRDMTRLAGSAWSMWRDILATNPRSIADAVDGLINQLSLVRDELRECATPTTTSATAGDTAKISADAQLALTRALFETAKANPPTEQS